MTPLGDSTGVNRNILPFAVNWYIVVDPPRSPVAFSIIKKTRKQDGCTCIHHPRRVNNIIIISAARAVLTARAVHWLEFTARY